MVPEASGPPPHAVRIVVERALAEDLDPIGDLTAALIPPALVATGSFVAREAGVVAGTACLAEAFHQVDPLVMVNLELGDGSRMEAGSIVATVSGPLRSILTAERTALNFACHLSGVATMTARFADVAHRSNPSVRILDTRKTTPGLRALEKAAVRAGGGFNHRGSLSEGVLIKDNHLAALSIPDAVREAMGRFPGRMVEVECDRLDQALEAVDAGATMILLDNMSPDDVAGCIAAVRLRSRGTGVLVEVSGGVTLETVGPLAAAGVDLISVGALTHSAAAVDIGLDIEPQAEPQAPSPGAPG